MARQSTLNVNRTTRMFGWQAMLITPVMPYALMALGTVGVLAIAWGLRWWAAASVAKMGVLSAVLMLSSIGLGVLAHKLYKPLSSNRPGMNFWLSHHVVATVVAAHLSTYLFLLFGSREFTWCVWLIGSLFVIASWMIRRMARDACERWQRSDGDAFDLVGSNFLVD